MNFRKIKKIYLIAMFFAFLVLVFFVRDPRLLKLNILCSQKIQGIGNYGNKALLFSICSGISFFGITFISTILVAAFTILFVYVKKVREATFLLLTPIAAGINSIIKIVVNTPRPSASQIQVMAKSVDPGFPSGHVVFYTVFFGFLWFAIAKVDRIQALYRNLIRFISIILLITVSFARLYLGAHWLSDVIGGYLLGGIFLAVLLYFYFLPDLLVQN
jgi:membrane-associated phospholipid phosphatase